MPTGQSKTMWQCKLHNLVANFGTNAKDVTRWPNFKPICKKSENAYLGEIQNWNIANLKLTITKISQSRFSGQREQTLSTCVLILISSWRGWTCSCTPLTPSSGTWSTLLYQNDSIHHQAEIQSGGLCFHQGGHVLKLLQLRHHVGYPGESGTRAPCFTGIAWANVAVA